MAALGRETREAANKLRAVAPLVVLGPKPVLVGPYTLVTNGAQTVAFSSAELLRHAGEPLAIVLAMNGSKMLRVASWTMGRIAGMGIAELAEPFPKGAADVAPLQLGSVSATVDTRGAPAAKRGRWNFIPRRATYWPRAVPRNSPDRPRRRSGSAGRSARGGCARR